MSLVGFSARNHPQQKTRDEVDDRAILPADFAPLHGKYQFTIDAAASAVNAVLPRFWTKQDDARKQSWTNERVWCNPPYSDLGPWLAKAWGETEEEGCELVVMLVPANRCEQRWWQHYVEPFRDGRRTKGGIHLATEFLPGRMRFRRPAAVIGPKGDRPPFGCVLLIWQRWQDPPCAPPPPPDDDAWPCENYV